MSFSVSGFEGETSASTFSRRTAAGRVASTTSKNFRSVAERGSLIRCVVPFTHRPEFENGWHGGPPFTSASSRRSTPAAAAMVSASTVRTSRSGSSFHVGLFLARVALASSSISAAKEIENPLASSPRSSPPAPVKRDSAFTRTGRQILRDKRERSGERQPLQDLRVPTPEQPPIQPRLKLEIRGCRGPGSAEASRSNRRSSRWGSNRAQDRSANSSHPQTRPFRRSRGPGGP